MSEPDRQEGRREAGENEAAPLSARKVLVFLAVVLIVAAVAAVAGILPRLRTQKALAARTDTLAIADVVAQKPQLGEPSQEITLPGNMFAWVDAPIYARTDGYLEKWYFDIGAHVKKGQLLATISSPEVDQQLAQAKAELATAESTAGYAKAQAARYQGLLQSNAVTQQDTENFVTQAASSNAQVKSAEANVQRLQEMVGFEKVYAPFSGTITARDVDIGTLINAGSGSSGGREMFHMADEHVLRVYVNVPQSDSPSCTPGTPAYLTLSELPGREFQGKVARTSRSIDPASRTLLVEVDVPNAGGTLVPGAFTQVHFRVKVVKQTLIIPVSTLLFRQEGLRVVTVIKDSQGHDAAKLLPITIGQDDGRVVQVIEGLQANDLVVQSPPDSIVDNERVRVVTPKQEGGPDAAPEENPGHPDSDGGNG
jgi:RND family efflux transporter MFP subunit